MEQKKFSLVSFIIGLLVGLLVATIFVIGSVMYFYNSIESGRWNDQPGIVRNIGDQVRAHIEMEEDRPTSVYGAVTKVEEASIEIEVQGALGVRTLSFRYDAATVVVDLADDDESSEIPMRAVDLQLGEGITIITNEPVGSVSDQYAVKIVKI